jgi:hypothetical protein
VHVADIFKPLINQCLRSDCSLMLLFCPVAPQHPSTSAPSRREGKVAALKKWLTMFQANAQRLHFPKTRGA